MAGDQRTHLGPVIRVSEIGLHGFCARSWWLGRIKGYRPAHIREMADGTAAHGAHGHLVMRYARLQRLAYTLLILAGRAGAVWTYLTVRACS